jgi:propionyl-CoA synthetase
MMKIRASCVYNGYRYARQRHGAAAAAASSSSSRTTTALAVNKLLQHVSSCSASSTSSNCSARHRSLTGTTTTAVVTAAAINNVHQDTATRIQGRQGAYAQEYAQSVQDPAAFWQKAADQLEWFHKPTRILEQYDVDNNPHYLYRWFSDGIINLSYNCLDVHVKKLGRAHQDALIYDSPVTNVKERYTYAELLQRVATLAGALQKDLNVNVGDTVVIYMPMIPQAVIAMLACARIGAIHSVVFGGFAAHELSKRIVDCQPKVIISASVGVEGGSTPPRIVPYKPLLEEALRLASSRHKVERCVIVQRPAQKCELKYPMDIDYDELMQNSTPVDAVPLPSTHLQHILYTSGTTGNPKGVVRDTGGWATALHYSMNAFYDTRPGEVQWTASDIGWIVGHAYIVYGPLLNGCTTVLYEGKPVGTPDAGAYWRVMSEYKVNTFFTAPTVFRAVKQADPHAELVRQYDLSHLKTIFLAGEHSDPATLHYCERVLQHYGAPVNQAVDHWWQTELGQPAIGNAVGLGRMPIHYGACSAPVPGFQVDILDEESGQSVKTKPGQLGDLVLKLPLPPGTLTTLYNNNHERFVRDYLTKFPGYYDTSDAAFLDESGRINIVGRVDDIINTAGHRLSTGAMVRGSSFLLNTQKENFLSFVLTVV